MPKLTFKFMVTAVMSMQKHCFGENVIFVVVVVLVLYIVQWSFSVNLLRIHTVAG